MGTYWKSLMRLGVLSPETLMSLSALLAEAASSPPVEAAAPPLLSGFTRIT